MPRRLPAARSALGDPLGLTQFGVNLVTLGPGSWSSQRHWHENEDEFIYVLEGEVSLVTDEGETGFAPAWRRGFRRALATAIISSIADLCRRAISKSALRATTEEVHCSDIDMTGSKRDGKFAFRHKNGEPYP